MASRSSAAQPPIEATELLALLERARAAADGATPPAAHDAAVPPWLPAELAPRGRAYRVEHLALTLHGYRVQRRMGWERSVETVFSLARPPWWRRLLRRAHPIACVMSVHAGGADVRFVAAGAAPRAGAHPAAIRLPASWQQRLDEAHGAARAARPSRLPAWLRARRAARA